VPSVEQFVEVYAWYIHFRPAKPAASCPPWNICLRSSRVNAGAADHKHTYEFAVPPDPLSAAGREQLLALLDRLVAGHEDVAAGPE
jgi:hypothetical protein